MDNQGPNNYNNGNNNYNNNGGNNGGNGGGNNGNGGVLRTADLHLAEQRLASVYDVFCQRSDLVSGILLRGESLAPGLVCPSGWHFMHPEKKWTVPLIMIGVSIAYFA